MTFMFLLTVCKVGRESFGMTVPPAGAYSKISFLGCITEFRSELQEDGGKPLCTSCNEILNHVIMFPSLPLVTT